METMNKWKEIGLNSISSILADIASAIPTIMGAFFVLLLGWVLSKIIRFVLKKILRLAKIDKISDQVNEAKLFGEGVTKINLEKMILGFVKWALLLVFVIIAADIVELTVISSEIANLLRYLPVLFSAIVIFMVGLYISNFIKKMLVKVFESMRLGGSKIVSGAIFYILVIFVTITALNHAGIDTQIITNNFTLILGAFLLAFALAFGLGSRAVVADLLRTFYARKNYSVGDKIKLKDLEGTILTIDSIFVTLETDEKKCVVLPIKELVENRIKLN
ncbi:MAG: mechanosensitive ion channel domain-containing protein [Maribacter sp.]|uniref:mechanosensitive ion channel family protein n=1 Tax=Maribacter sp. TaxID=1897614 RepID=UPI003296BC94